MFSFVKFLIFCSISTSIAFAETNRLRVALTEDAADTISQITQRPGQSRFIQEIIAPSVVIMDELWVWSCKLCTKLPSESDIIFDKGNKKFPYSMQWSLRPDIFWGDGHQLTAKDVKFTLAFLDKFTNRFYKTKLPKFKVTTSQNDKLSFSIHFESKRYDAIQLLSISLLPAHKSKQIEKIFKLLKKDSDPLSKVYDKLITKNDFFLDPGLYYGQFRPKSFKNQITLERNSFYKSTPNEFDTIELNFFSSPKQLSNLLSKESVDFVVESAIDVSELNTITLPNSYRVQSTPGSNLEQLVVNLRNPILSDPIIRQSLYSALNLHEIRAQAFSGYGAPAQSILGPKITKKQNPVSTDTKAIADILGSNGWQLGEDGIRRKLGKKLSFEILIDQTPHRRNIGSLIKKAWKKIGVEANIVQVSSEDLNYRLTHRRFSGLALQNYPHYKDTFWAIRFHSLSIPSSDNSYQGLNFMTWKHKKMDDLLSSIIKETNNESLSEHYQRLDGLVLNQLPIMPLIYKPNIMIIHDRLTNVLNPGHLFSSSSFITGWRLQEKSPVMF